MSNAFIKVKMCYVYNQWHDISCVTLYIAANVFNTDSWNTVLDLTHLPVRMYICPFFHSLTWENSKNADLTRPDGLRALAIPIRRYASDSL